MASYDKGFRNLKDRDRFLEDSLNIVIAFDPSKVTPGRENHPGPSLSAITRELRVKGWKNLGSVGDTREILRKFGFTILSRNNGTFVTLEN